MRILLGSNRYFPDVAGGGNRVAFDAAQYLAARGHDVALLCEGLNGKPEGESIGGIRVLRYSLPRLDIDLFSRHQRAAKRTLRRQLSDWQPDMLWGHMPLQTSAMMDVFPSARVSYTMHSPASEEMRQSESGGFAFVTAMKSKILAKIEHRCCEAAKVITVLSQFTRTEIVRLHGEDIAAKVKIRPGWSDLAHFRIAPSRSAAKAELEWPQDRVVFFCVRRFVARMGLDRLLNAAAIVRDRGLDFHLYVAGKGPLRTELESQIAELNLEERVRLVGTVSEEQLAAMYAAADAFVLPTRALECFGLVAVEAMGSGTPVLSTPVGALPEIISQIEPRWLARDNSSGAIALVIEAFIRKELPQHSADELRSFVEQRYSREKALAAFVDAAIGNA